MSPEAMGADEWRERIGSEYVRLADSLRRYALHLTRGDEAWAEDILSNAWFATIDPPTRPDNFQAWLRTIIYRQFAADCRNRNRELPFTSAAESMAAPDAPPDEPIIVEERQAAIRRLLDELLAVAPANYHPYLLALRGSDGSTTAIAEKMTELKGEEVTTGQVRSWEERLRTWLKANGYDVTGYGIAVAWLAWTNPASAATVSSTAFEDRTLTGPPPSATVPDMGEFVSVHSRMNDFFEASLAAASNLPEGLAGFTVDRVRHATDGQTFRSEWNSIADKHSLLGKVLGSYLNMLESSENRGSAEHLSALLARGYVFFRMSLTVGEDPKFQRLRMPVTDDPLFVRLRDIAFKELCSGWALLSLGTPPSSALIFENAMLVGFSARLYEMQNQLRSALDARLR